MHLSGLYTPPPPFSVLEPELEAMLQKTLLSGESMLMKVQAAPAEAMVLTSTRVIVLKGAKRGQQRTAYGRFFRIDEIVRFAKRGWPQTTFIAVMTPDTMNEKIPMFALWKCSYGTTFTGILGSTTWQYLDSLMRWLTDQRRSALLTGSLPAIRPVGVATQPGEQFHIQVPATYFEEKAVRQYVSGWAGVSVPVMRGIRFRVGQSCGRSFTQNVLQPDDHGTLAIGDRRVVFVGSRRNISIPLATITSVDAFADGLQIGVPNRVTTQFRTDDEIPGLVLKRLLNIP
jgi:hypothetical protein